MEINENKSSNINNFGQIGWVWVCPLCGRIWSPYVRECTCNQFYDPSRITCRIENKNGSKSIFEGQNSHIPQIDSNFNDKETFYLYVLFIIICICILINFTLCLYTFKEHETRIQQLESEVTELQTQVDGYIDNYVALWNTVNNK